MNKGFSTECLVLKNSNYQDADKLYTFFSPEYGKFGAAAKGVRRITSKRLGSLDTLNRVRVSFSESPSGKRTINQVQVLESYKELKKSISGIAKGLYVAELVYRFFYHETYHHESAPDVYNLLKSSLCSLNKFYGKYPDGNYNFVPVRVMNRFEAELLSVLGYEMSMDNFLIGRLELGNYEIDYLRSLKRGGSSSDLISIQKGHQGADAVIKEYVREALDEPVYSRRLL